MAGAINYTRVTDTSADWPLVPNSTYFYDKADKLVHYKDSTGAVLEIFASVVTDTNIYNTNGTLTANRILSMDGKNLRIENDNIVSGAFSIQIGEYNTAPILNSLLYQDKDSFYVDITDDNTSESSGFSLISNRFQATVFDGVNARSATLTPSGFTINSQYTLPNTDGAAFQALTTDGAGNLYWSSAITPSSAFIPPVEQSEIRRGVIAVSGSTAQGTLGAITITNTGSIVAIIFGGTVPLPKFRMLTSTGSTNSTVGINYGASGLVNRLGKGFRFIGSYIYSDQSSGGTNWFVPGARQFCGMATGLVLLPISSTDTVETRQNIIGMGSDSTDTNLQIFHNGTSATATKIDLGPNFPANKTGAVANGEAYQLELYNVFGTTSVKYRVRRLSDGLEVTGTISTNLPSGALNLAPQVVRTSGSTSQNVSIDVIQLTAYTRE
jgi:hypothetical protein